MRTKIPVFGSISKPPRQFLALLSFVILSNGVLREDSNSRSNGSSKALAQIPAAATERALKEAQEAFERDDFAAAARGFEQVRSAAPEKKEAWHGLVLCYLRLGDKAHAVELGRKAAERWPDDGETRHLLGFAYFQSGQPEPAIQELLQATRLMLNHYEPQLDLALAYLSVKKYVAASEALEALIRLKPQLPLPHILLGRAYVNTNRTLPAIEEF